MSARAPDLTQAEALEHPWLGVECPHCGAEPGQPCGGSTGYQTLHGQRTAASILDYVDQRASGPSMDSQPKADAPRVEQLWLFGGQS